MLAGFDGLDIDWEYPGAPDRGGQEHDTANYVALLRTLRQTFDASGGHFGLTFTAPSSYWYLRWFDLPNLIKFADWINFMTYDLHVRDARYCKCANIETLADPLDRESGTPPIPSGALFKDTPISRRSSSPPNCFGASASRQPKSSWDLDFTAARSLLPIPAARLRAVRSAAPPIPDPAPPPVAFWATMRSWTCSMEPIPRSALPYSRRTTPKTPSITSLSTTISGFRMMML